MSERYMDCVLDGRTLWTDIEAFVGRWHADAGKESLHDFLGMTWSEYSLWVEQPAALRVIIAARERDEPVEAVLAHVDEFALAARGLSNEDARTVRTWLQQTGRLPRR